MKPLKFKLAILLVRSEDLALKDKIQLIKAANDASTWSRMDELITRSADVWASLNNKAELVGKPSDTWDWQQFFDFLKWLIPLLLQLLNTP